MTETFICFRNLQQMTALPVTVTAASVGYIDIDVLLVQVLIALFRAEMHPSRAILKVRIRSNIKIHLLLTRHEDIVYANIVIDMKPAGIQRKIAYIRLQKAASEMCRSLLFQPFKPLADMLPRTNFRIAFVCYRILRHVDYSESVSGTVPNHYVFDDFPCLVDAIVHRIHLVGQTTLDQTNDDDYSDDEGPRTYRSCDVDQLIGFSPKITH